MTIRVSFDLSDKDLRHFRRLLRDARKLAAEKREDEETIIAAAEEMLNATRAATTSDFVRERLDKLEIMIAMLRDEQWQIPSREKARVLSALTYFAEEQDLIPDDIPVLGFLDDAIMIELVVRELRHEIEAYEDFRRFQATERKRPKAERESEAHDARLARKRKALHERMRRRASQKRRASRRGKGPHLSLI